MVKVFYKIDSNSYSEKLCSCFKIHFTKVFILHICEVDALVCHTFVYSSFRIHGEHNSNFQVLPAELPCSIHLHFNSDKLLCPFWRKAYPQRDACHNQRVNEVKVVCIVTSHARVNSFPKKNISSGGYGSTPAVSTPNCNLPFFVVGFKELLENQLQPNDQLSLVESSQTTSSFASADYLVFMTFYLLEVRFLVVFTSPWIMSSKPQLLLGLLQIPCVPRASSGSATIRLYQLNLFFNRSLFKKIMDL